MSKYRYWWWPNVQRALRTYPYLKALQQAAPDVVVTPSYSGMPHGGGDPRPTERSATHRRLSQREEEFVRAVDAALCEVSRWPDGQALIRLIELVDFKRTHTIGGAAYRLHLSERTARRKHWRFVALVGEYCGY